MKYSLFLLLLGIIGCERDTSITPPDAAYGDDVFQAPADGSACTDGSCVPVEQSPPAESPLLAEVPLVHDQTFLLPENAGVGDTLGDLNLMWLGPTQNVSLSLVDDDGGRFSLSTVTGQTCVSNQALDHEARLSVASAAFDFDVQPQRHLTVRATDKTTGHSADAVITVLLSKVESTVFIDPSWTGCHDGSRGCPFGSWDAALGGAGTHFGMSPGRAYLQRRGTTTGDAITTYVTGTPTQHIVIGAYGVGDRPVFDGSLRYSGSRYSVGIELGDTSYSAKSNNPVAYYDIYSLAFTKWYAGLSAGSTGTHDCTFTDLFMTATRGMGIYLKTNYTNGLGPTSVDILDHRVVDCVSELSMGEPADEYGFKSEAGGTTFLYDVARRNKDIGFSGASAGYKLTFKYCQSYDSGDGIKAHGDDILVDHSLIQDNAGWGVNVGNYYQLDYGLSAKRFHIVSSIVKHNGVGIHVSQDAQDGTIEKTSFLGNGVAIGFYHDGGFNGSPANFSISRSLFDANGVGVEVGKGGGTPYPKDITVAYDLFYDQTGVPVSDVFGTNVNVFNSVFFDNAGANEVVASSIETFTARNNLIEGAISASNVPAHVIDHNLTLQTDYFVDATARDFHLVSGAAPIDAGVAVGLSTDFDGKPISGAPDVGAFEH